MAGFDTIALIAREIATAIQPLREGLDSPERFSGFMRDLGWDVDSIPAPLADLVGPLDDLEAAREQLIEGDLSPASLDGLRSSLTDVLTGIDAILSAPDSVIPQALRDDGFRQIFPRQLVEHLLVEYLADSSPGVAATLGALGVVRYEFREAEGNRPPFVAQVLSFSEFPRVLSDPVLVLENAYGWRTDEFDAEAILSHVEDAAIAMGADVFAQILPTDEASVLEGGIDFPDNPIRRALKLSLFEQTREEGIVTAGLGLYALPGVGRQLPGLALLPEVEGELRDRFEIIDGLGFSVNSEFNLRGGVSIQLRPGEGLEVLVGRSDPASVSQAKGQLVARLESTDPEEEPLVLIGSAEGSRLESGALAAVAGLHLDAQEQADLYVEAELRGGKLVVAPQGGDGFVSRLLPEEGLGVRFDAAVGLSSRRGFYFRGSSALEATFPTHFSAGGLEVSSVTVALRPTGDEIPVDLGASLSAQLGPLTAKVENIGLRAGFAFPGAGGNLGPVDVDLEFKPPDGVGLAVKGGGFSGGGFLRFEQEEARYSGLLELEFEGRFTIKALGLLTTKLPGGKSGFSLLISLSAEFTPVQLGLGFTLNGVGGLLGLNRTVDIERLRRGVKEKTLDNVLFPTDLVANADRILSDLRQVFPPQEGRFTFGPMAIIGWGTPTLISIELGLVLEVPQPVRAALLGVLKSLLPDDERRLIVLQVNFLGALELEKRQISFDASLFESRLLTYTLAGDMALRLTWGENPNFLVSVGGFHPDYEPPPLGLPSLQRLTVNLLGGKNPRVTLESYYAITSNTVQFGARVELYAKVSKFNVYGFLGFDALFQFDPFHFVAALDAGLAVRIGTRRIMGVTFSGSLEGPAPWKATGKATFKIVFVKFNVRFNKTFGEERNTQLPDIDVRPLLIAALGDRGNWSSEFPARLNQLVTLKEVSGPSSKVRVHPAGTLIVSQRLAPLEITLTRFGNRRPSGPNRFSITRVSSGSQELSREPAREQFAPGQFQDFDDQERLSRKSFERLESGVRIAAARGLTASRTVRREVEYERKIIDRAGTRRRGLFAEPLGAFGALVAAAAGPSSDLGQTRPPSSPLAPEPVSVAAEGFAVVRARDLTLAAEAAEAPTQAEAVELMRGLIASRSELPDELQVVPSYEVNA